MTPSDYEELWVAEVQGEEVTLLALCNWWFADIFGNKKAPLARGKWFLALLTIVSIL